MGFPELGRKLRRRPLTDNCTYCIERKSTPLSMFQPGPFGRSQGLELNNLAWRMAGGLLYPTATVDITRTLPFES